MKRDPGALQAREHDLLVIGGGIAGAWVLWEAASRGLKAALVEVHDFGQATSWSSLKTAHGGLRHLQRADLAGFRESVRERRVLMRVAPDVVRPLGFAIPVRGAIDAVTFALAGMANDLLSVDRNRWLRADRSLAPARLIGPAEAAALAGEAFSGQSAFVWQDAQITHTERLLLALLHSSTDATAIAINHCRIDTCVRSTAGFDLQATDLLDGGKIAIRARAVVNASGAALETVANLLGETCGSPAMIRGVNVVLGRRFGLDVAVGSRDRGRFLFLVPWLDRAILGTVYDDGVSPVEDLSRELVEAGRRAFPWAGLEPDDVILTQAGHVPGASNGEPVYRTCVIEHNDPRLLSILTAKYTTARSSAQTAVDRIARALGRRIEPSVTSERLLTMAKPLTGTFEERMAQVRQNEMAMTRADALRGRLIEGALSPSVDSLDSEA
jgi:glycerol-3-phosphate dehydrogenase